MCVVCNHRQHCLRILAEYGSAGARAALESHMARNVKKFRCCAQQGSSERRSSTLATQNLAVALRDFSRKNSIECDIFLEAALNGTCALPTPDPIQRCASWQRVSFVEYVGSKVVIAAHDKDADALCFTLRLFPLVSTGYVSGDTARYADQRMLVSWPAEHSPAWLRTQLPRIDFALNFVTEDGCVSAQKITQKNDCYCQPTSAVAFTATPRCFLEYRVCVPRNCLVI